MLNTLFLCSVPIVLLLIVFKPKIGTFLIWPILFTYPHGYWYSHGFLPLNIGVDDLYCIFLFLVVVIRRNIIQQIPVRFGYAFWVIAGFAMVSMISHAFGFSGVPGAGKIVVIKDALKNLVYFGLFYAILHCVDDERDLRIQFSLFSVAAVAGAALVILQRFVPIAVELFASPRVLETGGLVQESRGAGAFMNPNAAACVLVCSLMLILASIRLHESLRHKTLFYLFSVVLLVAIVLTQSRTGLLAMGGTFIAMALFSRLKKIVWMALFSVILVLVLFSTVREAVFERFGESYNVQTGQFGVNVEGRFEIWSAYLREATIKDYVFGQGPFAASVKTGMAESHSMYISLLTVYGLGGIVWVTLSLVYYFVWVFRLRRGGDIHLAAVSDGCLWALLAWGIYGLSSDAISSQYPRHMLFYFVVLLDRAAAVMVANQQYDAYLTEFQGDTLVQEWPTNG